MVCVVARTEAVRQQAEGPTPVTDHQPLVGLAWSSPPHT